MEKKEQLMNGLLKNNYNKYCFQGVFQSAHITEMKIILPV